MPDIKALLTEKLGPLPAWGWVAVGLGVAIAYEVYKARKAPQAGALTATTTAVPSNGGSGFSSGGSGGGTSGGYYGGQCGPGTQLDPTGLFCLPLGSSSPPPASSPTSPPATSPPSPPSSTPIPPGVSGIPPGYTGPILTTPTYGACPPGTTLQSVVGAYICVNSAIASTPSPPPPNYSYSPPSVSPPPPKVATPVLGGIFSPSSPSPPAYSPPPSVAPPPPITYQGYSPSPPGTYTQTGAGSGNCPYGSHCVQGQGGPSQCVPNNLAIGAAIPFVGYC